MIRVESWELRVPRAERGAKSMEHRVATLILQSQV
jgi:hypothetical protein